MPYVTDRTTAPVANAPRAWLTGHPRLASRTSRLGMRPRMALLHGEALSL